MLESFRFYKNIIDKKLIIKRILGIVLLHLRYLINMYGARNLEMSIRFSLKSRPSERFHRPEMSQIKAEISLRTNVKLICHKNEGLQ